MFKVKDKYCYSNPKSYVVYSVRKADDGTTEFLMFTFGGWHWFNADYYEPLEEKE